MRRDRGFTLLEMLVALALGAALTAGAVASLVALVSSARLAGAARTVASGLRLVRARALADGTAIAVRFEVTPPGWEAYAAGGVRLAARRLPPGVSFAGLPARRRVVFGGLGTGENATVTLAAGARQRRVIVNQRGRVRVQ